MERTRKVVDASFYDLFGVSPDATSDQIRKAYYQRARSCHPDKHPGDAAKEAEFKKLSEAYQTLFDEERRAAYDALGPGGMQAYTDPRQVFAAVFGGPEFEPWVGVLGTSVDESLQERADVAAERVRENYEELRRLLASGADPDAIDMCKHEKGLRREEHRAALKAIEVATAELQRERVVACVEALEARIAPWLAAALSDADAESRAVARRRFESSIQDEAAKLRRCSVRGAGCGWSFGGMRVPCPRCPQHPLCARS